MDCKCAIQDEYVDRNDLGQLIIRFCPLHAAAPQLLEALGWIHDILKAGDTVVILQRSVIADRIYKAIAKAEGK